MKFLTNGLIVVGLSVVSGIAQTESQVQEIKRELQQMQERFQKAEEEHQRQLRELQRKIDELQARPSTAHPPAPVESATAVTATNVPPPRAWSPTDPLRVGQGSAYMEIGLVGTFAAGGSTASDIAGGTQLGGHDPNQDGFTVQGVEASFRGAVDPYFRAAANILFGVDADGEGYTEVEEAWMESTSLPGNLQLRGGQLMTDFGRLNTQHPHTWSFVDSPLVLARFLGDDGLRNPGARVSWLAPTPFYSELFLTVQNSGGTASGFRGSSHEHGGDEEELPFAYRHNDNDRGVDHVGDMLFAPRYAASVDLTDNQVVLVGASAAFGPNSSGRAGDTRTQVYGLDFTWKWKSPNHHGGFPFVALQAEALWRQYDAGAFNWLGEENPVVDGNGDPAELRAETLNDYGVYAQLLWGFKKGWVAGLRGDWVGGERASYETGGLFWDGEELGRDPERAPRWRISPNLTWYPSEFSKVRLQYNYDDRSSAGVDHSVWLQFEFLLGAHGAHQF
jgi:hypothetical protein